VKKHSKRTAPQTPAALGHSSGEEDGSTGTDEDDCEIWFDIRQNDYDGDGLTWWEEVNVYGMDPTVNNSGDDLDGDGMSIEWEDRYGLNDLDPGDALEDLDGDGLLNLWEFEMGKRNPANPRNVFKIRLTVSLEWDASEDYIEKLRDGFRGASLYMMTVTDGYAYISDVTIYNNKQNWDNVNIRIGNQNADSSGDAYWPHTGGVNGYWDGADAWSNTIGPKEEMCLPKKLEGYDPDTGYYSVAIVHELGHYVFGFYDEYADNGYDSLGSDVTALMLNSYFFLSYRGLYEQQGYPNTEQWANRGMSCWEWFVQQMGREKALIDFSEEAMKEDYVPYAARYPRDIEINYDFSHYCRSVNITAPFENAYQEHPPNYNILGSMSFEVVM